MVETPATPMATINRSQNIRVCVFRLAGLRLGLDVRYVQEVLRPLAVTPVPLSPATMDGLVNLRGQIVLAFNLRKRLDLPDSAWERPLQVVCLHLGDLVSFLVDSLEEVQEIELGKVVFTPANLPKRLREALSGVVDDHGELLMILDPARILGLGSSDLEKSTTGI